MRVIKILSIVAIIVLAILLTRYLLIMSFKNEAAKAKHEMVEKVKEIKFDDTAAAKSVAKTIHKFATFKDKVKTELKSLDSTDSVRGKK